MTEPQDGHAVPQQRLTAVAPGRNARVVVTRKLPDQVEAGMQRLFSTRLNAADTPFGREELVAALAEADVLVPTITDVLDAEAIAAAGPQLRLIANFGAGTNHIDIKAASARGITVTNTPGVLNEDTADMTLALILGVMRRIGEGQRAIEEGTWPGWSPSYLMGRRLAGKKLGIIGMGRVGLAVARRARAFGFEIHYHNRRPVDTSIAGELQATYWDSIDRLIAHMDVISLHAPLTPATYHILSARRLRLIRPDAYVINTARGELIDETALADLLEEGRIAGVGLDVFEREPQVPARLARHPRAFLMPHLGSATLETRVEMGERVIINIRTFLDGHTPPDMVLPTDID